MILTVGHGEGEARRELDNKTKDAIIMHKEDVKKAEVQRQFAFFLLSSSYWGFVLFFSVCFYLLMLAFQS